MRGRKPKPTHLKLVTGNPGKRRLNPAEPRPASAGVPAPPAELSDEAKTEWRRVARGLHRIGLLTGVDRAALAAYCQAWGRWRQAEHALAEMAMRDPLTRALMVRTKDGNLIQNPLVGIANKAMADMVRYAAEFGMTPSARSRIGAAPNPNDKEDPAESYFG
jgi:P27 family predicted phage terminase small subunit